MPKRKAPRKKKAPVKQAKKKAMRKPAAKKKAAAKKAAPKKKAARRLSLTGVDEQAAPMTVSVEFRLGAGSITCTLFRNMALVDEKTISTSGSARFDDARSGDELSLNGTSGGMARLTTNRSTRPASSASSPRKYNDQSIMDSLEIL